LWLKHKGSVWGILRLEKAVCKSLLRNGRWSWGKAAKLGS
jgi:hypothetical protein